LLTLAVTTAKKAFEFSLEGAQLEQLQLAGSRLATSMGADMDEIVEKVGKAAKGMVADSDIMASANKALMLGVTSDAGEMATLMEIAAIRAQVMGMTTQQAFDDIVRGLGRGSAMILDNLGIILDSDAAYEDYAKSIGKSTDALTKDEQKRAITNATLIEGKKLIQETGGIIETTLGIYERAQVAEKNYWDAAKISQTGMVSWWSKTKTTVYEALTERMDMQNKVEALSKANFLSDEQRSEALTALQYGGVEALKDYLDGLVDVGDTLEDEMRRLGFNIDGTVIDTEKLTGAFLSYKQAAEDAKAGTEGLEKATLNLKAAQDQFKSTADWATQALIDQGVELDNNRWLADALALASGTLTTEDITLRDTVDDLTSKFADGTLTQWEYFAALQAVNKAALDGTGIVAGLSDALNGLPREIRTKILIEQYGYKTGTWSGTGGGVSVGDERASGGAASAYHPYIVGEEGPEIIVPNASSYVVAHDKINQYAQNTSSNDNSALIAAIQRLPTSRDIAVAVRDAMLMVSV